MGNLCSPYFKPFHTNILNNDWDALQVELNEVVRGYSDINDAMVRNKNFPTHLIAVICQCNNVYLLSQLIHVYQWNMSKYREYKCTRNDKTRIKFVEYDNDMEWNSYYSYNTIINVVRNNASKMQKMFIFCSEHNANLVIMHEDDHVNCSDSYILKLSLNQVEEIYILH